MFSKKAIITLLIIKSDVQKFSLKTDYTEMDITKASRVYEQIKGNYKALFRIYHSEPVWNNINEVDKLQLINWHNDLVALNKNVTAFMTDRTQLGINMEEMAKMAVILAKVVKVGLEVYAEVNK